MAEKNELQEFLDETGLRHLWSKLKQLLAGKESAGAAANVQTNLTNHNTDTSAHNDLRLELKALADRINAALDSDDTTLDELSEIVAYIKSNKELIDAITTSKVSVIDIVNDLVTNVANKPLSAAQGVALKKLIDDLEKAVPGAYTHPETHPASMITGLATVATSGSYDDLSNKPTMAVTGLAAVTTSGTGEAYTATVDGITSLTKGANFIMIPHTSSTTTAPTLNVNGLGAKTIQRMTSSNDYSAPGYNESWLQSTKPVHVIYSGNYWYVQSMSRPAAYDLRGTVPINSGGTGYTTIEDTTYTTPRYRASALASAETNPSTNGVINWTYK